MAKTGDAQSFGLEAFQVFERQVLTRRAYTTQIQVVKGKDQLNQKVEVVQIKRRSELIQRPQLKHINESRPSQPFRLVSQVPRFAHLSTLRRRHFPPILIHILHHGLPRRHIAIRRLQSLPGIVRLRHNTVGPGRWWWRRHVLTSIPLRWWRHACLPCVAWSWHGLLLGAHSVLRRRLLVHWRSRLCRHSLISGSLFIDSWRRG